MRIILTVLIVGVLGYGGYWAYRHYDSPVAASAPAEADFHFFDALKDQAIATPANDEAELTAFVDALKGLANVAIGSIESEGDGAVARDVTITMLADSDVGATVKELRLWGADPAALAAFANGEGEGEGALIADRVDARGVEWFGLEKLTAKIMDSYTSAIVDAVESAVPEDEDGIGLEMLGAPNIGRYDVAASRFILDGLTLYPLSTDAVADDVSPLMNIFQTAARWSRIANIDAAVIYDMTTELDMEQASQKTSMTMTAPLVGYRGYKRGDFESAVARDLSYIMTMELLAPAAVDSGSDEELAAGQPISMKMAGRVDDYAVTGVKLAKLYEFLARGVLPPMSQHDVMNLGIWRVRGEQLEISDQPVYSVKEARFDLSKFHWLIPTDIDFAVDGIRYDVEGFMQYVKQAYLAGAGDGGSPADVKDEMDKYLDILKKYDLAAPTFDFNGAVHWNPATGDGSGGVDLGLDAFGAFDENANFGLANFDAFSALVPAAGEATDWQAFSDLARDSLRIKHAAMTLSDKGGIEKGFGLAVDFAKLAPEEDAGASMMRNADPADLRVTSAAMIRMTGAQAAQTLPQAVDYVGAIADFIQKGGRLHAEMTPAVPISLADIQEHSGPDASPEALVELLGFSLVHEPAAAQE